MNRYYEAVFDPVRRHGGMVSNVVGDSMLALWLSTREYPTPLSNACLAAIEISNAMREFRGSHDGIALPTRIGLHAGEILLGNIGAAQHFEYRPVGDIVNTATRLEGLNKHLGTRILVSREVISMAGAFLARDLGRFLLVGKSRPVHVFELVNVLVEATPREKDYCASFTEGMELFRRQAWEKATEKFEETLGIREGDGPSLFYLRLCARYSQIPPGEGSSRSSGAGPPGSAPSPGGCRRGRTHPCGRPGSIRPLSRVLPSRPPAPKRRPRSAGRTFRPTPGGRTEETPRRPLQGAPGDTGMETFSSLLPPEPILFSACGYFFSIWTMPSHPSPGGFCEKSAQRRM